MKTAFDGGLGAIAPLLLNWSPLGLLYRGITTALSELGVEIPARFTTLGSAVIDELLAGLRNGLGSVRQIITDLASSIAYWNDTRDAERHTVLAGMEENAKQLRSTYATEGDALAAARAEWQHIQRGLAEFELTLALGRADLLPETPLMLAGFKPQIDATAWLVSEVTHSLNDGGVGTVVRCEIKD